MEADQDGCEWVNVCYGTGPSGSPCQKVIKQLYMFVLYGTARSIIK